MVQLYAIICNQCSGYSYIYYISRKKEDVDRMMDQVHYDVDSCANLERNEIDSASMSKEIFEWLLSKEEKNDEI